MYRITKHKTKRLVSPKMSHGLMATPLMIVVDNDGVWRRVYDDWDTYQKPAARPAGNNGPLIQSCFMDRGERVYLTERQQQLIGWKFQM
jgi:hypothetical protein